MWVLASSDSVTKKAVANATALVCYHYKTDPYKAIVQKQSVIFSVRVGLSLGDDGRKK